MKEEENVLNNLCDCCEKHIIEKPWMSVKNHSDKTRDYHICSHTCYIAFTKKYGSGYWNDIINKEDFNEPRPVFEIHRINRKSEDITNVFDVEQIREEIELELENPFCSESDFDDYSTTDSEEDVFYEDNY